MEISEVSTEISARKTKGVVMITPKKGKSTVACFSEWVDDVETVLN